MSGSRRLRGCAAFLLSLVLGAPAAPGRSGEKAKEKTTTDKWNVAIVIHEGVELLDFAGPGEVFQAAAGGRAFRVYTVAESSEPIVSQRFLKVTPNYSIADCPKPDIIVIPGGNTNKLTRSKSMMAWIKSAAAETEVTFSVCTGAFALADLGLLDGREATTHFASLKGLERYPKIQVRGDRRVVDTGPIVTAAGVSAGIDGALYLVGKLCGVDAAKKTARYMEYRWEPDAALISAAEPKTLAAQARQHWFAGAWNDAAKAYQQIVTANPKDAVAFGRLGEAQMRLKNFKEAQTNLEQALRLGLSGGDVHTNLGRVYLHIKQPEKAAEHYENALRLDASDFFAGYNLACAQALAGRKEAALTTLEKMFEAGTMNIGHALLDEDLFSLRNESRFRGLFRRFAQSRPLTLVAADEPGRPLVVRGVVQDAAGKPLAGALLEIYHADNDGNYTKDKEKPMSEAHSRIFGYLLSGADGRFEFRTIYPGYYPTRKGVEGDAANVPAHIHINITAPGHEYRRTQVVFADDARMTPHWHEWAKKGRNPVVQVTPSDDKTLRCTCELRLGAK